MTVKPAHEGRLHKFWENLVPWEVDIAMEDGQKARLEALRRENRASLRRRQWSQDGLLQDCLRSLDGARLIGGEAEIAHLDGRMCEQFRVGESRHAAGARQIPREQIPLSPDRLYFVLWDNWNLPAVLCPGRSIAACLSEILAVSFDTYIFAEDFSELLHGDDRGRLWHVRV